jgi:hypothetical protein
MRKHGSPRELMPAYPSEIRLGEFWQIVPVYLPGLNYVDMSFVPFRVLRSSTLFIYGVLGTEACILPCAARVIGHPDVCSDPGRVPRSPSGVSCQMHALPYSTYPFQFFIASLSLIRFRKRQSWGTSSSLWLCGPGTVARDVMCDIATPAGRKR